MGFNEVKAEMTVYEERLGPYSPEEAPDIRVANLQPHQWWSRVGGKAEDSKAGSCSHVLGIFVQAQLEYIFFCAQQKPKSSWHKEGRGSGVHLHEYEVAPR